MTEAAGRTVVVTRSMDDELYSLASSLFPDLPRRRLVGRSAEGYLEEILSIEDADWVINLDEDAFVTDMAGVLGLIDHMRAEGYDYCGVPDGGSIDHRTNSPLVVNPFFNVFNVARIREKFVPGMDTHLDLTEVDTSACAETPTQSQLQYVEPFDPLLTWLSQNFRPLFLNVETHPDGVTTTVLSPVGGRLLMHTWYSRSFRTEIGQRRRIQARIRDAYVAAGRTPPTWSRLGDRTDLAIRFAPARVWVRRSGRRIIDRLKARV